MDFTTLQTEVFSAGFDYLNDASTGLAQVKRWINTAMAEIDGEHDWPYLEATATGTAPLAIPTLRSIEWVWDNTNDRFLTRLDRSQAAPYYADDLTTLGTPAVYYTTNPSTINVYPVATISLSVRFYKISTDLSAGADTPSMPARFHPAIVDLALAYAHRNRRDEAAAQDYQAEAARRVESMREQLLTEPQFVAGQGSDW